MKKPPKNFLLEPTPHTEAAEWLRGKPLVAKQVFDGLLPELRARAFTITGIENMNILADVRELVAQVPEGADWRQAKKQIAASIGPFVSHDDDKGALARAQLILRTHGFQAYANANHQVLERQADVFPFWQYLSLDDEKVRPTHAALHNVVLPADSPFWKTHTPPWDWGCRCRKVALLPEDVEDLIHQEKNLPPEKRNVLEGPARANLENNGRISRGPSANFDVRAPIEKGREDGFFFDPGSLRLDANGLRARYQDSPERQQSWNEFESWARKQEIGAGETASIWDWLNGKALNQGSFPLPNQPAPLLTPELTFLWTERQASTTPAKWAAIENGAFKSEKVLGGGVNDTRRVKNGVEVVFKSAAGEEKRQLRRGVVPGTQWKREIAASKIDEALNLGLVPPTARLEWRGKEGSAQLFQRGFEDAADFFNRSDLHSTSTTTGARPRGWKGMPPQLANDWQLLDDLLLHTDRHNGNWLARRAGADVEIALIDNGYCLPDTPAITRKRFAGPAEGRAIDPLNMARIERFISEERSVRRSLKPLLSDGAVDGMFARARALKARGTFGDFDISEINPHLPESKRVTKEEPFY